MSRDEFMDVLSMLGWACLSGMVIFVIICGLKAAAT